TRRRRREAAEAGHQCHPRPVAPARHSPRSVRVHRDRRRHRLLAGQLDRHRPVRGRTPARRRQTRPRRRPRHQRRPDMTTWQTVTLTLAITVFATAGIAHLTGYISRRTFAALWGFALAINTARHTSQDRYGWAAESA